MRTISTLIVTIFLACNLVQAQNDTMYIYKSGSIIHQQAIADIDSITFAKVKPFDGFDQDGNGYHTVTLFGKTWMVENLKEIGRAHV